MKKSILMVGASLALAATMVVGGTLAYYTDDEKTVNISKSGKVDVVLVEQQRNDDGTALESFEQGKELLPIVGSAQNDPKDKWGMPIATNYVDKIVSVQNKDTSSDAYVRVLVGIPKALLGKIDDSSDDILHYSFGNRVDFSGNGTYNTGDEWKTDWTWNWQDGKPVALYEAKIGGIDYVVDTYTYLQPLAAGESTSAAICGYYLDERVDWNDETGKYSFNGVEFDFDLSTIAIPVAVEAIQASVVADTDNDGIDAADITAAFEKGGMKASNPWIKTSFVSNADELVAALKDGGDVLMTADITVGGNISVPAGATLQGNGFALKQASVYAGDNATLSNISFEDTREGNASYVYAHDVSVTIDGCSFDSPEWDAVQITTKTSDRAIVINNCTFTDSDEIAYRYVHVEVSDKDLRKNPENGVTLVMTNNHFEDIDGCEDDAITVVGVFENNITVSGNTYTAASKDAAYGDVWIGVAGDGQWIRYYPDKVDVFAEGGVAVDNAEDLSGALESGDDVVLDDDVTGEATDTAPYGNNVGFVQKGGIFDGNGKTLTVEGGSYTYAIMTYGGTIKNVTIVGGERGIVLYSPTEDVILDNVVIDDAGYAINTAEHPTVEGIDLIASNSTINGWSSFAGVASASFINCSFNENSSKYWQNMGYDQDYDRLVKPYVKTTFTDCVFQNGMYLDLSALGTDCGVTLDNCTVNGTVITADNYTSLLTIELPSGRTLADCVIFK